MEEQAYYAVMSWQRFVCYAPGLDNALGTLALCRDVRVGILGCWPNQDWLWSSASSKITTCNSWLRIVDSTCTVTHDSKSGWYYGRSLAEPNVCGYFPKSHVLSFASFCKMQRIYYSTETQK
ncbi:unnamed protein product [Effrenium voratum]|nr:unnamed protein product [Effrenium voratum]